LILNNHEKILVIHRNKDVIKPNKWGLPGGVVQPGQQSKETARLKTEQEVGLVFDDSQLTYFGEFRFLDEGESLIFTVWKTGYSGAENEVVLNTKGHDMYKWERAEVLYQQKDLMVGMYLILEKYLSGK